MKSKITILARSQEEIILASIQMNELITIFPAERSQSFVFKHKGKRSVNFPSLPAKIPRMIVKQKSQKKN